MKEKKRKKAEWVIICELALLLLAGIFWTGNRIIRTTGENREMKLVLYEGPKSLRDAVPEDLEVLPENRRDASLLHCMDTKITVDGQDCYVYDTNVNLNRKWVANFLPPLSRTPFTYFDFEGRAEVVIEVPEQELSKVTVSPVSYGITPEIDKKAHTVSFTITKPDTYTLTFNDAPERAVHIFANPIEEEIPDFTDENVIYIGPGEWDVDAISLESGKTLYLSGGAVLHGVVNANFVNNVKVMGRGIIDGSGFEGWMGKTANIPLKFDYCEQVTIQDIIVVNPNAWVCQEFMTTDSEIAGLKVISARPNGDGITLQSCQNIRVHDCFIRSWDDSLVVKNYKGNSEDIHFSNMQLWTDLAQSMEIGYETNKGQKEDAAISDITFDNICVLHNYHKPVISVHNADDAVVSNITFSNITVEDAQMGSGDGDEMPYLIDLWIPNSGNWSTTMDRGSIRNITIENVNVLGGQFCGSRICGYDAEHRISVVDISGLTILGQKITDFESGHFEIDDATTEYIHIQ